jgi:anti-sigma regulatory factor (Ser/Thr protein kinase)
VVGNGLEESCVGAGFNVDASMVLRLPAVPASASAARSVVRAWCRDGRGVAIDAVLLATTEAVANSILHAYPDGRIGVVELHCRLTRDTLVVEVRDFGVGIGDASQASGGLGFGLLLIRRLSHADIENASPGTRITMRFPITKTPPDAV